MLHLFKCVWRLRVCVIVVRRGASVQVCLRVSVSVCLSVSLRLPLCLRVSFVSRACVCNVFDSSAAQTVVDVSFGETLYGQTRLCDLVRPIGHGSESPGLPSVYKLLKPGGSTTPGARCGAMLGAKGFGAITVHADALWISFQGETSYLCEEGVGGHRGYLPHCKQLCPISRGTLSPAFLASPVMATKRQKGLSLFLNQGPLNPGFLADKKKRPRRSFMEVLSPFCVVCRRISCLFQVGYLARRM